MAIVVVVADLDRVVERWDAASRRDMIDVAVLT